MYNHVTLKLHQFTTRYNIPLPLPPPQNMSAYYTKYKNASFPNTQFLNLYQCFAKNYDFSDIDDETFSYEYNAYAIYKYKCNYIRLHKEYNEDNKYNIDRPNCLSINSICRIFHYVIEGMAGETKDDFEALDGFLLRLIDASVDETTMTRSGVFIRNGYSFNSSFMEKIIKEKKSPTILDVIPFDEESRMKINDKVSSLFPNWQLAEKEFFDASFCNNNKECKVYIMDQIRFEGFWQIPFDLAETKMGEFYLGGDAAVQLPMMTSYPKEIFMYKDDKRRFDFIHLPYANDGCGMLIILPRDRMNKKQLVDFCNNKLEDDCPIDNFYIKTGKMHPCRYLRMPRFKFDSDLNMDHRNLRWPIWRFCVYLERIFDFSNLNLRNMVQNLDIGFDSQAIKLISKMNFVNDESGSFINTIPTSTRKQNQNEEEEEEEKEKEDKDKDNDNIMKIKENMEDLNVEEKVIVDINRGFLFAIVNKEKKILNFGLYNGK